MNAILQLEKCQEEALKIAEMMEITSINQKIKIFLILEEITFEEIKKQNDISNSFHFFCQRCNRIFVSLHRGWLKAYDNTKFFVRSSFLRCRYIIFFSGK